GAMAMANTTSTNCRTKLIAFIRQTPADQAGSESCRAGRSQAVRLAGIRSHPRASGLRVQSANKLHATAGLRYRSCSAERCRMLTADYAPCERMFRTCDGSVDRSPPRYPAFGTSATDNRSPRYPYAVCVHGPGGERRPR